MGRNPFKQAPGENLKIRHNAKQSSWEHTKNRAHNLTQKEKEWGKVKFSPIVRSQPATPWVAYKNEIIQKQQESASSSNINMNSEKAKEFLKKREENYRRMLITETQKAATKWESFNDGQTETDQRNSPVDNLVTKRKRKDCKRQRSERQPTSTQGTNKKFIDDELLKNFDGRKLSIDQKNSLRKAITKATHMARGAELKTVVKDMKLRGVKLKTAKK